MSEVTDLDIIVPDPKTVRFGGNEYSVPKDMPMEIFLRMNKAGQIKDEDGEPDQVAQIEALGEVIADLFTFEIEELNPQDERIPSIRESVKRTLMKRGTRYGFSLMRQIYKADDDADESEGESEAQAPEGEGSSGTKSSSTSQSPETAPKLVLADQAASSA